MSPWFSIRFRSTRWCRRSPPRCDPPIDCFCEPRRAPARPRVSRRAARRRARRRQAGAGARAAPDRGAGGGGVRRRDARRRGSASEIGYHVRFEQRGGRATRLWFVTEGVLGRQLTHDPFLESVGRRRARRVPRAPSAGRRRARGGARAAGDGASRSEAGRDVGDARDRRARRATSVAPRAHLGRPRLPGRDRVRRRARRSSARRSRGQARPSGAGDRDDAGDVLVFLPGAAEIRRVGEALAPLAAAHDLLVLPLHGDLPLDEQERALRRGRPAQGGALDERRRDVADDRRRHRRDRQRPRHGWHATTRARR